MKAALTGDARQVWWDTDPVAIDSLSKLTTLLRSRFSGSRQAYKCKMDLKLRRRKPGESLTSLHRDIRRLMALAYPKLEHRARESIASDCFLDALDDPDMALKVRERAPADLDEALVTAMILEAWANDVRRQARYRDDGHRFRNRGVNEDGDNDLSPRLDPMDRQLAELRKFRAEVSTNETKSGGVEVSRQQAVPTAQAGESSTNREQESTTTWPRKRILREIRPYPPTLQSATVS